MNKSQNNLWRAALAVGLCAAALPSAVLAQDAAASDPSAASGPYLVAANEAPPLVPPGTSGRDFFKQGDKTWEIGFSPYVHHWSNDPAHKRVGLVNLERHNALDHSFWGGALFTNSFGQNSAYGYYGHEWNDAFGLEDFYVKASVGIIWGYRGPYQDKLPAHFGNFAPVIIPGVGYRITQHDAVQMAVLGTAGVIFMYSRSF